MYVAGWQPRRNFFNTCQVPRSTAAMRACRVRACATHRPMRTRRAAAASLLRRLSVLLVKVDTESDLTPTSPVPGLLFLITSHSTHSHLRTPRHARVLAMG